MHTLLRKVRTSHSPRSLADQVRRFGGLVLLESSLRTPTLGRYSLVAVEPLITFRSTGARCELTGAGLSQVHYGNPWRMLEAWLIRFDAASDHQFPHPAGGCFGYWGYELRQFVEPKLRPHPVADLALPDCWLGFYDSLVVFDHLAAEAWVISTGLEPDGGRSVRRQRDRAEFWSDALVTVPRGGSGDLAGGVRRGRPAARAGPGPAESPADERAVSQNLEGAAPEDYEDSVRRAQVYIRQGDIYQVNLARRWQYEQPTNAWELYRLLAERSPAPFAGFVEGDGFAVVSASPEQFLRCDGSRVLTRPIKGTRPRGVTVAEDEMLGAELLGSAKERAELTMITDLLRNDLGRVCAFGSVRVPELVRLERYAQVQHLVSTVVGHLRREVSHLRALEACFPGGSVTGAPKIRAMQLIDELEPVARGPYTGCLGYLGFNGRSQVSIIIRAAFCDPASVSVYAGAGIVADSRPELEQAEVLAKAGGLREILDNGRVSGTHLARPVNQNA